MAATKVFTQSFAELYGPKFGIYINDQQTGIDGRQVYQFYGCTDQDLKSSIRFSESGALKIHSDKSIEIAAGEYNEDKGVDINIQARRGNVTIKADRNGNVTVSGANIIVKNNGKNINIFCCIGSGGVGLSFCCKYIVNPIRQGQIPIIKNDGGSQGINPNRLKMEVGSRSLRSEIQP